MDIHAHSLALVLLSFIVSGLFVFFWEKVRCVHAYHSLSVRGLCISTSLQVLYISASSLHLYKFSTNKFNKSVDLEIICQAS